MPTYLFGPSDDVFTRVRSSQTGGYQPLERYPEQRSGNPGCTNPWTKGSSLFTQGDGTVTIKTVMDTPTPGYHRKVNQGGPLPYNPFYIKTAERYCSGNPAPHDGELVASPRCQVLRHKGKIGFGDPAIAPTLLGPDDLDLDGELSDAMVWCGNQAIAHSRNEAWDALTFAAEWTKTYNAYSALCSRLGGLRGDVEAALKDAATPRNTEVTLEANPDFGNDNLNAEKRQERRRRKSLSDARRTADKRWRSRENKILKDIRDLAAVPSAWLEYRYGLLPLFYDLSDAVQALEKKYTSATLFEDGRATRSVPFSVSDYTNTPGTGAAPDQNWRREITGTATVRGYALTVLPSRSITSVDLFATGWELVPFSFALDWVYDVGTWLQALNLTDLSAATTQSGVSVKVEYESTWTYVQNYPGRIASGTRHTGGSVHLVRDRVASYWRHPQGCSRPRLYVQMNRLRWADAIALLLSFTRPFSKLASGVFAPPGANLD